MTEEEMDQWKRKTYREIEAGVLGDLMVRDKKHSEAAHKFVEELSKVTRKHRVEITDFDSMQLQLAVDNFLNAIRMVKLHDASR